MKQFISLLVFAVLFSTSGFAQNIEGELNQGYVEAIFDTAQTKIFYETSYYILKIGVNEAKATELAKEINIYEQLKNLSGYPAVYNCLMYAKFPNSKIDSTGLLRKNAYGSISVNGTNISADVQSLTNMRNNIASFLKNENDILGNQGKDKYAPKIDELIATIDKIIGKAKTDAENYLKTDEYNNNLPKQDNTDLVDENQIVDDITEVDTDKEMWETATKTNTIQSYQKYLTDFPKGKYANSANNEIIELQNKQEENAWDTAKDVNTIEEYKKYIKAYPEGKYINNANEKIKILETGEEPKPNNYLIYFLVFFVIALIGILLFVNVKNNKKLKEKEAEIKRIEAEKLKIQAMQNANSTVNTKTETTIEPQKNTIVSPPIKPIPETKPINLPIGLKGDWTIVGASVIGKSHIEMNKPCQDSHSHIMLNAKWGIAVTSDGAGSAKLSDIGSKAVAKMAATIVFKKIVEDNKWHITNKLPSQTEWEK